MEIPPATKNSMGPILAEPPIWIDTSSKLTQLVTDLTAETIVAVDTESDSLYSYFEKVCLIQFSTPQADYLVDPLTIDVSALADLFADPTIQKIFHAADYDILSLKRDYDFTFANLFDTMIAAKVLGWPRYGLGNILADHFDINLDKSFQRYNWGQRPLSQKALDYARLDTHYLFPLRALQLTELEQKKRLADARAVFDRLTQLTYSPKVFDPEDFWRIKGCRKLLPRQQAIVRELYILRDNIARKIDRPPFKVMNDTTLIKLALDPPKNYTALKQVKGVGQNLLKYNFQEILAAIQTGQSAALPHYQPNNHRPDGETLGRYEALRHWRNALADTQGIEPDIIMNNGTLMHIARRNPKSLRALAKLRALGAWQHEKYGQAVLKILKEQRPH